MSSVLPTILTDKKTKGTEPPPSARLARAAYGRPEVGADPPTSLTADPRDASSIGGFRDAHQGLSRSHRSSATGRAGAGAGARWYCSVACGTCSRRWRFRRLLVTSRILSLSSLIDMFSISSTSRACFGPPSGGPSCSASTGRAGRRVSGAAAARCTGGALLNTPTVGTLEDGTPVPTVPLKPTPLDPVVVPADATPLCGRAGGAGPTGRRTFPRLLACNGSISLSAASIAAAATFGSSKNRSRDAVGEKTRKHGGSGLMETRRAGSAAAASGLLLEYLDCLRTHD